jgi:hypothetical protein
MCTVKSASEVMICEVSRDRVRDALRERIGDAARLETVHGEGTRFTCVVVERISEFQESIKEALTWDDDSFKGF